MPATPTARPYRATMLHRLTIAAIYTAAGEPITDADAVHNAHCTTCKAEAL